MHATVESPKSRTRSGKSKQPECADTNYAVGEINAYIAIRDELLAEAEELRTGSKLASLVIANDFVETCLTPSREPYQGECLPESDATRERERCQQIKGRVAVLRSGLLGK